MGKTLSRGAKLIHTLQILDFFSGQKWLSLGELAAHMDVTLKTARRWLYALEEAHVPIEYENDFIDKSAGRAIGRFRRLLTPPPDTWQFVPGKAPVPLTAMQKVKLAVGKDINEKT